MVKLARTEDPLLQQTPAECRPPTLRAIKTLCSTFPLCPDAATQKHVLFVEQQDSLDDLNTLSTFCRDITEAAIDFNTD